MLILCADADIPQTLLLDVRADPFAILGRIAEANAIMSADERESAFIALGPKAGPMVWDCITNPASRAMFLSRMRQQTHYLTTSAHDSAIRLRDTLKAAKLAVIVHSNVDLEMVYYSAPLGEIDGRFYTAKRMVYRTKSGAISAARKRCQDHADKFLPHKSFA